MEVGLDLFGGTGSGGGGGVASLGDGSLSSVSKAEVVEQDYVGVGVGVGVGVSSEVSSYPNTELDLGLGLSLGSGCSSGAVKAKPCSWGEYGRILTAKDFPSIPSSGSSSSSSSSSGKVVTNPSPTTKTAVSGTKRAADSIAQENGCPNGAVSCSQVVGWPPLRNSRINILVNQTKNLSSEDDKMVVEKSKNKDFSKKKSESNDGNVLKKSHIGSTLFVKVNMDGVAIGRKVDLNAHACYETLSQILDDMFFYRPAATNFSDSSKEEDNAAKAKKASKLLGGSSEYVLTYEDKDGDWMLVGDVPWEMFLNNVKRLRIMRTSEANGLAPRSQGSSDRQRIKPI